MSRHYRRHRARPSSRPGRAPALPRTPQEAADDPEALIRLAHGRLRGRNRRYRDDARFEVLPDGKLHIDLSGLPVEDLLGLADFPIAELDLAETDVQDLRPLADRKSVV